MISRHSSSVPKQDVVFPDCSTVIRGARRLVARAPSHVVGTPRLVAGTGRCSQAFRRHSQACRRPTHMLPGAPEGHRIGPVHSGIWPPSDSGLTTLRHTQSLPVTKLHNAYVLSGSIKRLVVELTATFVEFHCSHNCFDYFKSYSGHLELQLYLYWSVETSRILRTIQPTWINGQYMWVLATSTRWLHHSLRILQASLLPCFLSLRIVSMKGMKRQMPWTNNKSVVGNF